MGSLWEFWEEEGADLTCFENLALASTSLEGCKGKSRGWETCEEAVTGISKLHRESRSGDRILQHDKIQNCFEGGGGCHSVVSNSLQPHGLQHAKLPCPSLSPGVCSNSCPSSRWCHPTISSSVVPFSSCLQSFPESGSFLMNQVFASGGQSIGTSALTSVLPMNIQDWFPLGLTGWISLQSKGLSRVFSNTTVQKHRIFGTQPSLWSNSYIHTWLLEKP